MKRLPAVSLAPVTLALITAFVFLSSACAAPAPATGTTTAQTDGNYTVRIGFPSAARDTRAPDGPDIWALDRGMFEEEFAADGIKVEYIAFTGAAPAINEALAAGSLDMAVVADIGALIGKAAGVKHSLVAMGDPRGVTWWLLVSPNSKITRVTELKGKKVATVKATLPHFYLLEALKANGMQPSDIELINMQGPDAEQALRTGQIDAAVSGATTGARLLSQGFKAIDSTEQTPTGRGTMAIIAADKFISAHPSFFPRFYKVRNKATEWANANRSAAIEVLAKSAGGINPSLVEPLYPAPFGFAPHLSPDVLVRVRQVERFLRDMEITRNPVDVDAWIAQSVVFRP